MKAFRELFVIAAFHAVAANASTAAAEWRFDVLLDDKPIGYHHFQLQGRGERELKSEARFNVKFLFLNAYRYAHDASERWSDNCLAGISARTDDNGVQRHVHGARGSSSVGQRFRIVTNEHAQELEACVMTFAYWNPRILEASHLLNPQTGEYVPVRVTHAGLESLVVRGKPQLAERYRLVGAAKVGGTLIIDLWYSADKEWLALESTTEDGRRLRYRLR